MKLLTREVPPKPTRMFTGPLAGWKIQEVPYDFSFKGLYNRLCTFFITRWPRRWDVYYTCRDSRDNLHCCTIWTPTAMSVINKAKSLDIFIEAIVRHGESPIFNGAGDDRPAA